MLCHRRLEDCRGHLVEFLVNRSILPCSFNLLLTTTHNRSALRSLGACLSLIFLWFQDLLYHLEAVIFTILVILVIGCRRVMFGCILNFCRCLRNTTHTLVIVVVYTCYMCRQLLRHRRCSKWTLLSHDVLSIWSGTLMMPACGHHWDEMLIVWRLHEDLVIHRIHLLLHEPNDLLQLPCIARLFTVLDSFIIVLPNYFFFDIWCVFLWFLLRRSPLLSGLLLALWGSGLATWVFVGWGTVHILRKLS